MSDAPPPADHHSPAPLPLPEPHPQTLSSAPLHPSQALALELRKSISPYLSPEDLAAYKKELGDETVERLIDHNLKCIDLFNAEQKKAAEHRRQFELAAQAAAIEDQKRARDLQHRGQTFAACLVGAAMLTSIILAAIGREIAAGITGGSAFLAVAVVAFLRYGVPNGWPAPAPKK